MKRLASLFSIAILAFPLFWSCTEKELEIPVTSVTLSQPVAEMLIGESITLKAIISPSDATVLEVIWASSKQSVAFVDQNGKVIAIAEGTSTITATAGGKMGSCVVTVSKGFVAVSSISLNKSDLTLVKGGNETLIATVNPSDATNKTVSWTSSNSKAATVDSNGKVSAVAGGSATITATAGNQQATCVVTVNVPVESVSIDHDSVTIEEESSITLVATVKPDDATNKKVEWSSSNTNVATVDNNGVVTGITKGSATITAKVDDKKATCVVNVAKKTIPVSSISLNKTKLTLKKGQKETLVAAVKPDDATNKTVSWSTSDASVATVSDGVVTAINLGSVTITAKVGDKEATCAVTVEATPVTSVSLDKTSASLKVGETLTLKATVKPDDATDKSIKWSSNKETVATVNRDGIVTAISGGTATITAEAGGKTATCTITVYIPVESITLSQNEITLLEGQSKTLTATVNPSNATDKTIYWLSDHPEIASVADGTVTALRKGQASIIAYSGNIASSCTVTVLNENDLNLENNVVVQINAGTGIAIINGVSFSSRQYTVTNNSIVAVVVTYIYAPDCSYFSYPMLVGGSTVPMIAQIGSVISYKLEAGKTMDFSLYFKGNTAPVATVWFNYNNKEYRVSSN